jgi:transposase InsO family protein
VTRFIDQNRGRFGVEPTCRTLGVSASAYHQRNSGKRSARRVEDERLTGRIREVHKDNYECYGYRRVHAQLVRDGEQAGRDRIARLMRKDGVQGAKRRGKRWKTTIPDPTAQKRPDLVKRDFTAPAPDRLWVGDFTYLRTWEGRVFFAFILDVFSRRIVGWQLASNMRTTLVLDALRMALGTRGHGADFTLIHHTDHGSQYNSEDYEQELYDAKVLASMGTVGDAYDNAMAESFVDTFKTELIKDRVWHSNTQLELAVVRWVAWYNDVRLHSSLGNRPPAEHEARWCAALASLPQGQTPPTGELTLNGAGVYDPFGLVSAVQV